MRLTILMLVAALMGCDEGVETDRCERQKRFDACMAILPAGPVSTMYNDWDEVVESCDMAALRQSRYIPKTENRSQVCGTAETKE